MINGSHRGSIGNTNIMVSAFLKGAKETGAETAGREIAANRKLTAKTMELLEQKFIPDEVYI